MDKFSKILGIIEDVENIVIRPSAFKHGIKEEDIKHAVEHYDEWLYLEENPDKIALIGYDTALRQLELIIAEFTDGDLYIIHAMKLTENTLRMFERYRK